mmetsp:Transcript_2554/g.7659  ORF Transcript_2554/g.7659 Transcript_2554/m.7659 type:complete len:206 (+) Transcript_2554:381-998(+)
MSAGAGMTAVAEAQAPANTCLSAMKARGRLTNVERMVSTPKRLAGVMFSPLGLSMESLEQMLRSARARSETTAPRRATQQKESSLSVARATPATIGTRERPTLRDTRCLRTMAERAHAYTGPAALTTCAKLTEPAAVPMVPARWPMAWKTPMGSRVSTTAGETRGGLRAPVVQRPVTKMEPTTTVAVATDQGRGRMLVTFLLVTE